MQGTSFATLDAPTQARAVKTLAKYLDAARRDPAVFAQFAFHSETTQQPIVLAPHQRLMLKFIQQFPMCVVRMPVGASKTFLMSVFGLWMLGKDLTSRGAVISAGVAQARKPLLLMKEYITTKRQLELVFPHLRKSNDPRIPWAQDMFTIVRPPGIKDPSMKAFGINGKIPGARLSWVLGDDMLTDENTRTKAQRDKVMTVFNNSVMPRLDPVGGRCVVTNTPWDRDDITYQLEKLGWPSITMSIEGWITFGGHITPQEVHALFGEIVRPSLVRAGKWRLRGFDPDYDETTLLWPERYPRAWYDWTKSHTLPHAWAQAYLCEPMSADAARCLREWVDAALEKGRDQPFPGTLDSANPRFTGVDIGGVKHNNDLTSICTIDLLPDGKRRILSLQSGRWHAGEMMSRIVSEAQKYDSDVYIESNAAQTYLAEFAELFAEKKPGANAIRIHKFNTGRNKYDAEFGVEAVFTEMMRGLWVWPNQGKPNPELEELGGDCVFYNPEQHTGDRLMALFLARQGLNRPGRGDGASSGKRRNSAAAGGGF